MSPRRSSEHEEAVARRLAALTAGLAAQQEPDDPRPWPSASWADGHTRVRGLSPWGDAQDDPEVDPEPHLGGVTGSAELRRGAASAGPAVPGAPIAPLLLPRPGRHAARRWSRGWGALLPAGLRGRVALGTQHVAVVAVLACLGLATTAWWLVRSGAQEVVPVSASAPVAAPGSAAPAPLLPTVATGGATSQADGQAAVVPGEVVVDVAGKVRRPGIAVLPAGSRVADALEAAGGARPGVDLTTLNLARPLVDGEQVLVGVDPPGGAVPAPAPSGAATAPTPASGLVSLNTADQATLETLPGVGPVTAGAILAWREANGGFRSVDELIDVDGIGEKTLASLLPLVTL